MSDHGPAKGGGGFSALLVPAAVFLGVVTVMFLVMVKPMLQHYNMFPQDAQVAQNPIPGPKRLASSGNRRLPQKQAPTCDRTKVNESIACFRAAGVDIGQKDSGASCYVDACKLQCKLSVRNRFPNCLRLSG